MQTSPASDNVNLDQPNDSAPRHDGPEESPEGSVPHVESEVLSDLRAKLARVEVSRDELARQQGQHKGLIAKVFKVVLSQRSELREGGGLHNKTTLKRLKG